SSSRAERKRIGTSEDFLISRQTSRPSNSGMPISRMIRSGLSAAKRVNASLPSRASNTVIPAFFSATRITSRMCRSSSTMRMRCVKGLSGKSCLACSRTLVLGVQGALQPPAPKAPAAPGCHLSSLLFYKATTAGNKGGIEPAKGNGPVDGRQCLRSQGEQIVHVDPHALAGGFAAVADIVVGDDGGEIDQRADIERRRKRNEVRADQPVVRPVQNDAGDDEHESQRNQPHP